MFEKRIDYRIFATAVLLALPLCLLAGGCSSNKCVLACNKIKKCKTKEAGAEEAGAKDAAASKEQPGWTCPLSAGCNEKESCQAACYIDADCAAITGGVDQTLQTCLQKCLTAAKDGAADAKKDGGKKDGGKKDGPTGAPAGSACTQNGQCQGKWCLQSVHVAGAPKTMTGGYCTQDCSTFPCPQGSICFENKDGAGTLLNKVCIKECAQNSDCRESENYSCPSGLCLPN